MTTQTVSSQRAINLRHSLDLGELVPATATQGQSYNRDIRGHNTDPTSVDYYHFVLHQPATVMVVWGKTSPLVPFQLIHNAISNYSIDVGEVIAATPVPAAFGQHLRLEGLGAGTYYLEVGRDPQRVGIYDLMLIAQVGVPQAPVEAYEPSRAVAMVGQLSGKREFAGAISTGPQASRFYRFTLTQAVSFKAVAIPLRGTVHLALYHNDNTNQHLDPSELLAQSTLPNAQLQGIERPMLTPGTYYLRVQNPAPSGTATYRLTLEGVPVVEGQVQVILHEIRALQQFDSRVPFTKWHEADFFGIVKIANRTFKFGPFADSDVVKNQRFTSFVDPNQRFVSVHIEVNDEDNNGHDRADIAPERGVQHIALRYDTLKREIIGITGFKERHRAGTIIRLRGTGGDWTHNKPLNAASYATELTFSVTYTPLRGYMSRDPF